MELQSVFANHADYRIRSQKLGQGPFGDVYLAEHVKDNKEFVAKLFNFQTSFDGSQQMLFLQKSLILNKLYHPTLVKLIGINLQSFSDPKILQPTIITEYFGRGSLKDNLNKEEIWTPTTKCINLLGIISALKYLHEQGISHGDLKPSNILIDDNNYPHICDYCLCKCFPESYTKYVEGQSNSPLYLPEEIFKGKEIDEELVDVYSFSMIAYEILTGNSAFSETSENIIEKVTNGYRPTFPEFVSEKMQKLLSRCWSSTPSERPRFKELFDELSSDFSYFNESIDKEEVQHYLDLLSRKFNSDSHKAEFDELKVKITEFDSNKPKQLELIPFFEDLSNLLSLIML